MLFTLTVHCSHCVIRVLYCAESVLQPKHIEPGSTNDGFSIGGMLASKYTAKYAPKEGAYASIFAGAPYQGKLPPPTAKIGGPAPKKTAAPGPPQMPSFVLNEDMVKLRQAELVILKEEEKFGALSLDPNGRLVPKLQVKNS